MKTSSLGGLALAALFLTPAVFAQDTDTQDRVATEQVDPNESGWVLWETSLRGRNIKNLDSLAFYARKVVQDDGVFGDWSFADEKSVLVGVAQPGGPGSVNVQEGTRIRAKKASYIDENGTPQRSYKRQDLLTGAKLPPGDYVITEMQYQLPTSFVSRSAFADLEGFGGVGGSFFTGTLNTFSHDAAINSRSIICFNNTSYLFTVRPGKNTFLGKLNVRVPFSGLRAFKRLIPIQSIDVSSDSSFPAVQTLGRTEIDEVKLDTEGSHCTRGAQVVLADFSDREF